MVRYMKDLYKKVRTRIGREGTTLVDNITYEKMGDRMAKEGSAWALHDEFSSFLNTMHLWSEKGGLGDGPEMNTLLSLFDGGSWTHETGRPGLVNEKVAP